MTRAHFVDHPPGWIPDLTLERHRLGELPQDQAAQFERLVSRDERLRERLRALARSDDEIKAEFPSRGLAEQVIARLPKQEDRRRRATLITSGRWLVPLTAVASLALLVRLYDVGARSDPTQTPAASDSERQKGPEATLSIYRRTATGTEMLRDNDLARAGDIVRLGYRTADRGYGAIVSVDGRGMITVHMPSDGDRAAALEPGQVVLLDKAFELDDAPTVERFYLITAAAPFTLEPVLDALGRAKAIDVPPPIALPSSFSVTTFSLRKDTRP